MICTRVNTSVLNTGDMTVGLPTSL